MLPGNLSTAPINEDFGVARKDLKSVLKATKNGDSIANGWQEVSRRWFKALKFQR